MTRRLVRWTLAVLVAALTIGTSSGLSAVKAQDGGEPLKVVATYSILGDLVQNVGGEWIDLTTIVEAGGDAHTFEPTPQDAEALADADVVFENGLDFEPWLDDLYEASGSDAPRVVATDPITPLEAG